jgi:hypothetical protein
VLSRPLWRQNLLKNREGIKLQKFAIFLLEIGLAFGRDWSVTDSTGGLLGIGISPRSGGG